MIPFLRVLLVSLVVLVPPAQAQQPDIRAFIGRFEARNLTETDKRFLQAALAFQGAYRGLLDGDWGRLSQGAFERYAQRRFASAPEDWHMVILAMDLFELMDRDGWDIRYYDDLGLSFLVPTKTLRVDAPSAQFAVNMGHRGSSLAYSLGRHDAIEAQSLHDFTLQANARPDPYVVRRETFAVTSGVMADGTILYTRSDFRFGGWSTVMLSALPRDAHMLNAVSGSIEAGRAKALTFTQGGWLDQALEAALAMLEEDAPDTRPAPPVASVPERQTGPNAGPKPEQGSRGGSAGSGFYVSAEGHVMTNAHVVEGCGAITVDGRAASLVDASDGFDLALLKTAPDDDKAVAVFSPAPARLNSDVTAIGYPYGGLLSGLNVTRGSVSAMSGLGGDGTTMQVTAPIQQGNSGGPLVGPGGQVVGVVVSKLDVLKFADLIGDVPQNVNFAVRGEIAKLFMAQNGLDVPLGQDAGPLGPVELAEQAQRYTAFIACE